MGILFICVIATISTVSLVKIYQKITNGVCRSQARLDGKTVVITGANSGIGKQTTLELAKRGARIVMGCRNVDAGERVRADIIKQTGNPKVIMYRLDLSSLASVREFSKHVHDFTEKVHVLINNAGAAALGNYLTDDGLLAGMQVNHFGPFLLTNLLSDLLIEAAPSRVVTVSSMLHRYAKLNVNNLNDVTLTTLEVYANTKLCNVLMSNELARRLEGTAVTSNCLHPGAVRTTLFRNFSQPLRTFIYFYAWLFFKSIEEGTQTTLHLAISEEVKNISGDYFADCVPDATSDAAQDEELAGKLWELSEKFVKLSPDERIRVNENC